VAKLIVEAVKLKIEEFHFNLSDSGSATLFFYFFLMHYL
jgi:hypothetical protein